MKPWTQLTVFEFYFCLLGKVLVSKIFINSEKKCSIQFIPGTAENTLHEYTGCSIWKYIDLVYNPKIVKK